MILSPRLVFLPTAKWKMRFFIFRQVLNRRKIEDEFSFLISPQRLSCTNL